MSQMPTEPQHLPFEFYPLDQWTTDNIADYFTQEGLADVAVKLKTAYKISGRELVELRDQDLREIKINEEAIEKTKEIIKKIQKNAVPQYKVFNDPIHGHIELHPLCVKIIDTPEFQRLRFIKQLGACYLVYPGAAHNRFEHSLGVCHLAGQLVRAIKDRQPEYHISSNDILCVEIAGLCHDLGHGPFSHLFDLRFIPLANQKKEKKRRKKRRKKKEEKEWKHEQASVKMLHHMLKKNGLKEEFTKYGLTHGDLKFIKEQILGLTEDQKQGRESGNDWPFKGRDQTKGFLYEVVANKRNGIDVDKWDYFARDCHNLGIRNNFDHLRFIKFARVLEVDGEHQICSRDKEVQTLYDMFNTRVTLHKRAYQHRVNVIIEHMITEAFLEADKHLKFAGTNGKLRTMSESINDMEAYSKLTDGVFDRILTSDSNLEEAQIILTKVLQRKLYKYVGHTKPNVNFKKTEAEKIKIRDDIAAKGPEKDRQALQDNLIVEIMSMDYGTKDSSNPIDSVRFYDKWNPDEAKVIPKEEVSRMIPSVFTDQSVYLYIKTDDIEFNEKAMKAFERWCKDTNSSVPRGGIFSHDEMTPCKQQSSDTKEFQEAK